MSELKVNSLESNNTLTANSVTIGNATINASGITAPTYIVNTSAVAIGNSSANITITANSSVDFVVVNNATNVFPNPLDIYAWASLASGFNNCTVSRDTTIPVSPAGGIPFKITPTGGDPHPSTYNANTWNLASTANNDIWKISGYVRANGDITISAGQFLLILPANSSGNYGTAGGPNTSPSVTLTGNTWTYFEKIFQINGTAETEYIQIRPDGPDSGVNDFWYDGLSLQKVVSNTYITETVNTQLFTANGTWTKPSWATDGKELVIVHMWGGGGGSAGNTASTTQRAAGGGGAFVFGYFIANNLSSTQAVIVGTGGLGNTTFVGATSTWTAGVGGSSSFANLIAYGGGGAIVNTFNTSGGGGGGGWLSAGQTSLTDPQGGGPLGGNNLAVSLVYYYSNSTFGGGAGQGDGNDGGNSIYGGGGGAGVTGSGGDSIYGGGGGQGHAVSSTRGTSIYGGAGGLDSTGAGLGSIPGGGGAYYANGARGEVRIYTLRIVS